MDALTKVSGHELEWTAAMLERITIPRNCKKPLAYISSVIKKTTLKMSGHRSVCGSDGGLEFLWSVDQMIEDVRKEKKQSDQRLGVLETQTKDLELRNDLLDESMKVSESKLGFTQTQLGLRESEIDSLQETLHVYEERMSSLRTLVAQVDKRLADLESTSSTSRQPFQTESSY